MNTEIENIIRDHNYSELNSEQLAVVKDWTETEEEYTTMRQIITSAPLLNDGIAPSQKLKASLMDTFAATHATAVASNTTQSNEKTDRKIFYFWMRGVAAVAAILLVVLMVYPLFSSDNNDGLVADNKTTSNTKSEKEVKSKKKAIPVEEEKQEVIEGVTESSNQLADNTNIVDVSERVPVSNAKRLESPVRLEGKARPTSAVSSFGFTTNSNVSGDDIYFSSGSGNIEPDVLVDAVVLDHSDRISVADLPDRSRQVMQEQPELFDLLHTSF